MEIIEMCLVYLVMLLVWSVKGFINIYLEDEKLKEREREKEVREELFWYFWDQKRKYEGKDDDIPY